MKKLLGIVVLGLLLSGCGGPQDAGLGSLIYIVAVICVFAVGVLISPIWEIGSKTKKIETTLYDRENPSHAHLFKGYPKYKDRYIEVPNSRIEKDKFWKDFRKKYFN